MGKGLGLLGRIGLRWNRLAQVRLIAAAVPGFRRRRVLSIQQPMADKYFGDTLLCAFRFSLPPDMNKSDVQIREHNAESPNTLANKFCSGLSTIAAEESSKNSRTKFSVNFQRSRGFLMPPSQSGIGINTDRSGLCAPSWRDRNQTRGTFPRPARVAARHVDAL